MATTYTLTKANFLEWYFNTGSDDEQESMRTDIGKRTIDSLFNKGKVKITVGKLFGEADTENMPIRYLEEFKHLEIDDETAMWEVIDLTIDFFRINRLMEAEKSIIELYEIVKDKIRFRGYSPFICFCANKCLTYEENKRFIEHFYSQRPSETQYTEFYNEPLFRQTKSLEASWFEYDYSLSVGEWYQTKAFKLRIQLLEAIIKNLKKEQKKVGRLKK